MVLQIERPNKDRLQPCAMLREHALSLADAARDVDDDDDDCDDSDGGCRYRKIAVDTWVACRWGSE